MSHVREANDFVNCEPTEIWVIDLRQMNGECQAELKQCAQALGLQLPATINATLPTKGQMLKRVTVLHYVA